jgi:hypothetical protein
MASSKLSKGDRVRVSGLVQTVHLNGKLGTVVIAPKNKKAHLGDDVKYGIHVDGEEKPMAIKRSMLSPVISNEDPHFQIGDLVVLHGLITTKYNGRRGVIERGADMSNEGRYTVRLNKGRQSVNVKSSNLKLHVKTTKDLERERNKMYDAAHQTQEEELETEFLAFMRMMMHMAPEETQIDMYGRRIEVIPDFIAELKREGGFPAAVDHRWACSYLRLSHEQASSLPHIDELHLKSLGYEPDMKDYVKRLATNHTAKLGWYLSDRAEGDIYTNQQDHGYARSVRHNYSNQVYRGLVFRQGSTHVAVGFVDLGILMSSRLTQDNNRNGQQLRFIVVERSAFTVAKTHVIWELIRECASVPERQNIGLVNSIVQVWYSSTWTKDTELAVKRALNVLCRSDKSYDIQVRLTLEHWKSAPSMPLQKARKAHKERTTVTCSNILKMKLMMDRVALARYELTGDFAVRGGDPLCGSIIMFDCPDGTPPSDLDESVFAAFDFERVMEIANDRDPTISIVEAAEEYARQGVKKLVYWCQTDKVAVELVCSSFESEVDHIARQKPQTMTWSNLLDYIRYEEFHDKARQCSRFWQLPPFRLFDELVPYCLGYMFDRLQWL